MKKVVLLTIIMLFCSIEANANYLRGILVQSCGGQYFYLMQYQHNEGRLSWHLYRTDGLHMAEITWMRQFGFLLWVFFGTVLPQHIFI